MASDLIEKAKKMVAKIKKGNVFKMNLKAVKLMEAMIKELEKYTNNKDDEE